MDKRYLVMLDTLMDTRLGTLLRMSPENSVIMGNAGYYGRYRDNFADFGLNVDLEEYKDLYSKRDKITLRHSIFTAMNFVLGELVRKSEREGRENPDKVGDIGVVINYYPYDLTPNEVEAFRLAIGSRVGVYTPIKMVSIPIGDIHINFLKDENITDFILYDYAEWANLVFSDLENHPENAPYVKVRAAALLNQTAELPNEEDFFVINGIPVDPFSAQAIFWAEVIGLEFLPLEFYCVINPKDI